MLPRTVPSRVNNTDLTDANDVNYLMENCAYLDSSKAEKVANLSSNHTYNGMIANRMYGEVISFGDILYQGADSKLYKADPTVPACMPAVAMALNGNQANTMNDVLFLGIIRNDSWAFTTGSSVYADYMTKGGLTSVQPTSYTVEQSVGKAITPTIIMFNPQMLNVADLVKRIDNDYLGSGWIPANETWSFGASDQFNTNPASSYQITAPEDVRGKYSKGMKLKCSQNVGLTSYWPLVDNVNDTMGLNTASSYTNTFVAGGPFGQNCAYFNGSTFATLPVTASLQPTGSFTIGCWIKTSSLADQALVTLWAHNGTLFYGIRLTINNGIIACNTYTGASAASSSVKSSNIFSNGNWHFVVYTLQNNWGQLYIDGALSGAGYAPTPVYTGGSIINTIGCRNDDGTNSYYFTGYISDLFIISGSTGTSLTGGYALSEQEIKRIYDSKATIATSFNTTKNFIVTNDIQYNSGAYQSASYWNFDTDANDLIGTNTGTFVNGTKATMLVAGKFGNALSLTAANSQYISFPDNTKSLMPTGDFTIGCWIKTGNYGYVIFASAYVASGAYNGIFFHIIAGGYVGLAVGAGAATLSVSSSRIITDNQWHYIVATQRNGYTCIYIDGILDGSGNIGYPIYCGTTKIRMGCRAGNGGIDNIDFVNGLIDDFYFINGYAQDAATVASQYALNSAQGTIPASVPAYSSMTVYGGNDFALTKDTISNPYYSMVQQPYGFNRNPDKWSITYMCSGGTTACAAGTIYNIGSAKVVVPIGIWTESFVGVRADSSTIPNTVTQYISDSSSGPVNHTATYKFEWAQSTTGPTNFRYQSSILINFITKRFRYVLDTANASITTIGYYSGAILKYVSSYI